jgi:predicted permease
VVELGGSAQIKEECRDVRVLHALEVLLADLRYALRGLRASPAFTLTAVISIALGIGANATIFTLLHAALWKPLPVPEPQQLYEAVRTSPTIGQFSYSYVLLQQLEEAARPYGEIFAKASVSMRKFSVDGTLGERAAGESVSGKFFDALRVSPFLGRVFEAQDDTKLGGRAVAVLSYAFWQRRFASDPGVLGKTVLYDEQPFTIVGVARPGFQGVDAENSVDVWTPISATVPKDWLTEAHSSWMRLMFRLRRGVKLSEAQAAIEVRLRRHVVEELAPRAGAHWGPLLLGQRFQLRPAAAGFATTGRKYEKPLLVLLGVAALVLLISCANVANLVLARNLSRQPELTVRLALGAGRARIVSQLLTESVVVALTGSVLGVALAQWGSRLVLGLLPASRIPWAYDLRPDPVVIVFASLAALLTSVLFGVGPALRASRAAIHRIAPGSVRVTQRSFAGKLLVSGQLALSLVLAAGAGLFLATLYKLATSDLGFRTERAWTADLSYPRGTSDDHKKQSMREILQRLAARDERMLASSAFPNVYDHGGWSTGIEVDDRKAAAGEDNEVCGYQVGARFFETLRIGLVAGREFNSRDDAAAVIVNQTMARRFFGMPAPLGHHLKQSGRGQVREVVGVVQDVHHQGVREPVCATIYVPGSDGTLLLRSDLSQAELTGLIAAELKQADATAALDRVRPMQDSVAGMITQERMIAMLSAAFGGLAAVLAAVGLYGVMAYNLARRTGEIGIRMALGARPVDIRSLVLREALLLIGAGLLVGLPAALLAAKLTRGMLYGLNPGDPAVFAAAVVFLIAVGVIAACLPAWRASRTEPAIALRTQ